MRFRSLVLAAALVALSGSVTFSQEKPAAESDRPSDTFCPVCRRPATWEQDRCKCGATFEPAKPRTVKKDADAPKNKDPLARDGDKPAGDKPGEKKEPDAHADESPFPGPPPGAPADKVPASQGLIPSPWEQVQPPQKSRFGLSSYGRVGLEVGNDLKGAKPLDLVDFAPRLGKSSYQELHFFYKDVLNEMPFIVKSTLAFGEKLFHYDGDFDAKMAVRELYAELEPTDNFACWIGARMYRGDPIYIFDFWPLDDQNTLGAGVAFRFLDFNKLQFHMGANRIIDKKTFFQFQTVEIPLQNVVGTREAVFLDRNRGVASTTYTFDTKVGLKAKLHAEGHYIPPDHHRLANGQNERLPADHGFLIGGQVGYKIPGAPEWGSRSVDLFARYSTGLAAYDELSIPFGFNTRLQVTAAKRLLVALGGGFDTEWFGVHYGAWWQQFTDADKIADSEDSTQIAAGIRPMAYLGQYFRTGFEVTWQSLRHKGIFPETGNERTQQLTKLTLLAGVAPNKGLYTKPELLLFYSFKWLNQAAAQELGRTRLLERPKRDEQSFGVVAEWWF